jgi:hypothetical protein
MNKSDYLLCGVEYFGIFATPQGRDVGVVI